MFWLFVATSAAASVFVAPYHSACEPLTRQLHTWSSGEPCVAVHAFAQNLVRAQVLIRSRKKALATPCTHNVFLDCRRGLASAVLTLLNGTTIGADCAGRRLDEIAANTLTLHPPDSVQQTVRELHALLHNDTVAAIAAHCSLQKLEYFSPLLIILFWLVIAYATSIQTMVSLYTNIVTRFRRGRP